MIEKLKTINPYDETEIDMDTNSVGGMVYENTPLIQKINELVDAVNRILDYAPLEMAMKAEPKTRPENVQPDAESRPENAQDKFAKQRKWVGKLCKFWDIDNDNLYYGPLTKIHDTSPYCYECNHKMCYANCEPVKDDIIYKGGDNE